MIVDHSFLDRDDLPPVVIVGSGPAGLTLASRLATRGIASLMLEGGEADWSEWSQEMYQGEVIGDRYFELDHSRLRYFGGTSNHWEGWCRPFDEGDFAPRPDLGVIGWGKVFLGGPWAT